MNNLGLLFGVLQSNRLTSNISELKNRDSVIKEKAYWTNAGFAPVPIKTPSPANKDEVKFFTAMERKRTQSNSSPAESSRPGSNQVSRSGLAPKRGGSLLHDKRRIASNWWCLVS